MSRVRVVVMRVGVADFAGALTSAVPAWPRPMIYRTGNG